MFARPHPKVAYSAAIGLSAVAAIAIWLSFKQPWLIAPVNQSLSLTRYCVNGQCESFPSREFCAARESVCAGWRTAVFAQALAFSTVALVALIALFSAATSSRRRVATVLNAIVTIALVLTAGSALGLYLLTWSEWFTASKWRLSYGALLSGVSVVSLSSLQYVAANFRQIIKGSISLDQLEEIESDSDPEVSNLGDEVSSDEDVTDEDRDFRLFQKQARRDALRAAGEY